MKYIYKLVYLTTIFLIFGVNSYGQMNKGDFLLGGSFGIDFTKTETGTLSEQDVFAISFSPDVSYFITERFTAGLSIPLTYRNRSFNDDDFKFTSYSIGPIVRYYFPLGSVAVFPQLAYSLGRSTSEEFVFDPDLGFVGREIETDLSTFSGGLGLVYFISPSVGLEGLLTYQRSDSDSGSEFFDVEESSLDFNIGFQIYFSKQN